MNTRHTWFKPPKPTGLTAGRISRLEINGTDLTPYAKSVSVGSYAGAKQAAMESATAYVDRELHRPSSTHDHRTVSVAGKPYHWRQDYTGQLKLAGGVSPW